MDERTVFCFSATEFKKQHIQIKITKSLQFNVQQIVMLPWERQKGHRIINYCISMDLRALVSCVHTIVLRKDDQPTTQ
jgi:hypothetical protein